MFCYLNICPGRLKVKVTLEGQMRNGHKLSLSGPEFYIYAWISN